MMIKVVLYFIITVIGVKSKSWTAQPSSTKYIKEVFTCTDSDVTFKIQVGNHIDCNFVSTNLSKKRIRCQMNKVRINCPRTCGVCSEETTSETILAASTSIQSPSISDSESSELLQAKLNKHRSNSPSLTWCKDATKRFQITSIPWIRTKKNCDWANSGKKWFRCGIQEVKFNCPLLCNYCDCLDNQSRFGISLNGKTIKKSCVWAQRRDTRWRCNAYPVVKYNCPRSCGMCPDYEGSPFTLLVSNRPSITTSTMPSGGIGTNSFSPTPSVAKSTTLPPTTTTTTITTTTLAPTIQYDWCLDNIKRFEIRSRSWIRTKKNCQWAVSSKQSFRCRIEEVRRNCPNSCNNCSCIDNNQRFTVASLDHKKRSCKWARRKATRWRCNQYAEVKYNCPRLCGECNILSSAAPSSFELPSSFPSLAPSDTHSSSPPTEEHPWCVDTTKRFFINSISWIRRKKDCKWAVSSKQSFRCSIDEVKQNCPRSCGNCNCFDNSKRFYVSALNNKSKGCQWAQRKDTWWRCIRYAEVMQNCPLTCGKCNILSTAAPSSFELPSSFPSLAPSDTHSSSPPTEEHPWCVDTTKRFFINSISWIRRKKDCKWTVSPKQWFRCSIEEVKQNCPRSCGNCNCFDNSKRFYVSALNNKRKGCQWAQRKDTWWRCKHHVEVMQNCPLTCGKCNEGLISSTPSASPTSKVFPTLLLQTNTTIDLISLDLSISTGQLKMFEDVLKQVFQKYVPTGALVDFVKSYYSFEKTAIGKTLFITSIEFDCETSTCEDQFESIAMYEAELKELFEGAIQNNEILADVMRLLEELGILIEWIPNPNAEILIESTYKIINLSSSLSPSISKSDNPSASPTDHLTKSPTKIPSVKVTISPTKKPTINHFEVPSIQPTTMISEKATEYPSKQSSSPASFIPVMSPTRTPRTAPSSLPSMGVSSEPIPLPSASPSLPLSNSSKEPSSLPSFHRGVDISSSPSNSPSTLPLFRSAAPTLKPSITTRTAPSSLPSLRVSSEPSSSPSALPTTIISGTFAPSIPYPCQDFPPMWHDSEGSKFDCDWYSDKLNCSFYGNDFQNARHTANTACCTCGGGI